MELLQLSMKCPTCGDDFEFNLEHIAGYTKMRTSQTVYLEAGWYINRFYINNVLRHTCWQKQMLSGKLDVYA